MCVLPLGKVGQQAYSDASSPVTNSTAVSSQDSHYSDIESIEGDMTSEICGFDSPINNLQRKQSTVSAS
jgi:peptidoglycan hydrolase CwlO-like protein